MVPETRPPLGLADRSLDALAAALSQRSLPPVERWNPGHCGDSEMAIGRDGRWTYRGEPIERAAMVRLFATVLRREPDGSHVLVTPAVAMTSEGAGKQRRIALEIDYADALIVGPRHPLVLAETAGGPSPRVLVRHGLQAELSRPVYYELAELALAEGEDPPGVWSDGAYFPLAPAGCVRDAVA